MTAPQITMIILLAMNLLFQANAHGKPREGNDSFWRALIGVCVTVGILIWGGFFK